MRYVRILDQTRKALAHTQAAAIAIARCRAELPGASTAGALLCRDTELPPEPWGTNRLICSSCAEIEKGVGRLDRLANLARFRQLFET